MFKTKSYIANRPIYMLKYSTIGVYLTKGIGCVQFASPPTTRTGVEKTAPQIGLTYTCKLLALDYNFYKKYKRHLDFSHV